MASKANAIQVQRVAVSRLKQANHNPKSRTVNSRHTAQLKRSIEKVGLIYPLLVDKNDVIIDGHRRLKAVMELGWDEVPVILVGADDPDAVYAEVNANSRNLSSAENLQVYIANENAVTAWMRTHCQNWEARLGRSTLVRLAKAGMSLRTLGTARKISTYVSDESDMFIKQAAMWLIRHRCRAVVDAFILTQQPPAKLYKAVQGGQPLRVVYQAQ